MGELAAVMTMVKDDHFQLQRWVNHYGGLFGRQALYVLNHGGSPEVARIAQGCNVIRIPPGYDAKFNSKRAHILSTFSSGLLKFFDFVIVVDVDEFIVVDPESGLDLKAFLGRRKRDIVITPIGLEVIHRPAVEPEPIANRILAVRRHVRYSSFYCKPCILGRPVKLSRGGHYSSDPELRLFRNLYLFHMKYCDRAMALATMKQRGATIEAIAAAGDGDTALMPTRWNKDIGSEEDKLDYLASFPVGEGFDFSDRTSAMEASWGHREHDLYHFERFVAEELFLVPDRFADLI